MVVHPRTLIRASRRVDFLFPPTSGSTQLEALTMTNQQNSNAAARSAAARRGRPKFFLLDRRAQYIAGLGIGADPDMLLVTKQLAEWLGVSKQWLEIARSRGDGPPFRRLGTRAIRYCVGDVLRWLEERSHKSTAEYGAGEV